MSVRICDQCRQKPATVHYMETKNGVKSEVYLCPECAAKYGIGTAGGFFGEDLFGSFPLFAAAQSHPKEEDGVCPQCKTDLSRIRRDGAFGCPACYDAFAGKIDMTPFVGEGYRGGRLFAGSPVPEAKAEEPVKEDPVAALKAKLKEALAKENYEEAAVLRDQIRAREGQ